jgi:hypothetical protein
MDCFAALAMTQVIRRHFRHEIPPKVRQSLGNCSRANAFLPIHRYQEKR